MERSITWSLVALFTFTIAVTQGFTLFGEDKRQGLIPFPRVGRSFYPVAVHPELDELDDVYSDDPYAGLKLSRALFSPRLGRRKRSLDADEAMFEMEELGEVLRNTPWAVVALRDGIEKKAALHSRLMTRSSMAPRLGRKRSESSSVSGAEAEVAEMKRTSFSPRLGRAFSGDLANHEIENESRVFGARMGRASNFSPRLGRSATEGATPAIDDTKSA